MRHIKYTQSGTRLVYDGALRRCGLVVMGQRDEKAAAALLPAEPAKDAPEEQKAAFRDAVRTFRRQQTSGYFADSAIEWCATQKEAEAIVANFTADGWKNIRIEAVSEVIGY